MWRSIEFVLISKHEIIADEFCRQLPALRKELKQSGQDPTEAWTIVCEFLALRYAAGAIGSGIKEQLVLVLRSEAKKQLKQPNAKVLDALLLAVNHPGMQNYYKSSPDAFAGLVGAALGYVKALIGHPSNEWLLTNRSELIGGLLNTIRGFVKQTPQLDVFQKAFTANAFVALAELVVLLKQRGHNVTSEFFAIVQELYFTVESTKALKAYLNDASDVSDLAPLFNAPTHVLVLWIEAILIAFKLDTETQSLLHKFLFERFFSATQTRFQTTSELLQAATHYVNLLKRHDAQMNTKLDAAKTSVFIGQHIEQLFAAHCDSQLGEVLGLLCAALRLEPMMFERQLVPIAVRCMVIRKDEATAERCAEFLCLVIDVFRRLNRADNFIAQVIKFLVERLAETKLSNKKKRKSLAAQTGSSKNGVNGGDDDGTVKDEVNVLFAFLQSEFAVARPSSVEPPTTNEWNELSFAWPATVGASFSRFISGLVTKPSLIVWKTIIFSLTDLIVLLKEGRNDPNTLFLVDFNAALLCQYFDGARLAEHAHNAWPLIDINRQLTHSLLQEFGTAILSQEHSVRTMNAFLRCCYQAANFELVCFYYWPDTSMAPTASQDDPQHASSIHPYLAPQQWTLIEQRITNFGRNECRANINRLYLQRLRSALLLRSAEQRATSTLSSIAGAPVVTAIVSEMSQIEAILSADGAAMFLAQLSVVEFAGLCALVLDSEAPLENLVAALGNNRSRILILYVSIVKRIAENFGAKKSIFHAMELDVVSIKCDDPKVSLPHVLAVIRKYVADGVKVKKFNGAEIARNVQLLKELPVEFVGVETRNLLCLLNVAMYVNAKATGDAALIAEVLAFVKGKATFSIASSCLVYFPILYTLQPSCISANHPNCLRCSTSTHG